MFQIILHSCQHPYNIQFITRLKFTIILHLRTRIDEMHLHILISRVRSSLNIFPFFIIIIEYNINTLRS